jgi:hypothetical protein
MVGRLVEHQTIRFARGQECERRPAALPRRKGARGAGHVVAGQGELRQQRARGLLQETRAHDEDLEPGTVITASSSHPSRSLSVAGVAILIHESDADSGAEVAPPCGQFKLTDQRREQGGLPAPVGARDQNAITPPNVDVEWAQPEIPAFDDRALEPQHDIRTPRRVAEGQL